MTGSDSNYTQINLEYIMELGDNDAEFVSEIIGNFLENTPQQIEELSLAITKNDKKDIQFWSHKLKGTFRFIGCTETGNVLELMEHGAMSDVATNYPDLLVTVRQRYITVEEELQDALSKLST